MSGTQSGSAPRKYERIADDLRADILAEVHRPGRPLPGENKLAAEYGVAPETVRKALKLLQDEGLTVTRAGSGVYVREYRRIRREGIRRLTEQRATRRSMWEVETRDRTLEVVDLQVRREAASPQVARVLLLAQGDEVCVRSRTYVVDGKPVSRATSYLPWSLAEGTRIVEEETGPGGIYGRLAELGHEPVRFVEELVARMPREGEAQLLGLLPGTPVIDLCRTALTSGDRPVEMNRIILDGGSYVMAYEFTT